MASSAQLPFSNPTPADPAPSPDADAILGLTSYNRHDFELPVVTVHPSQHDPVRSSLFKTLGSTSQDFDLGNLNRLPFEILTLVCRELDVASAFRFSHVNRSAREVLESIREFRHLSRHALECLCVVLRTGLGKHIGVLDVYSALTTQQCRLCGLFGGFFYLPTATRCCITCIASAPEMQVCYLSRVADKVGIPVDTLKKRLPVLHTLPDSRKRIVAVRHTFDALRESGVEDPEETVSHWSDSLTLRFQAATALPYFNRFTGEAQSGVSCKGCQIAFEADFSDDHLEMRDRFYSKEEFPAHFGECRAAQKLWADSEDGSAAVEEPLWMGLGRTFTAPCSRRRSFARSDRSDH